MTDDELDNISTPVPTAAVYDENAIKTLSSLEHIRHRPGMYIGKLGDGTHENDGVYVLIKEVIDNSVDEFIMGCGRRIDVTLRENFVKIRDYGRGIPLEKLVDCVSQINTGAKYNSDVFQFSVGLNGVGTKAVNALSERFAAISYRDGKFKRAEFERGKLLSEEGGATDERNGTLIEFIPDNQLFPKYHINPEFVKKRLWMYAYLNSGLSLYLNGTERFYSRNGLKDLIENRRPFFYFSEKFSQPQNGEFFKSLKMSYFHYLEKFSGRNWNFILPQKKV